MTGILSDDLLEFRLMSKDSDKIDLYINHPTFIKEDFKKLRLHNLLFNGIRTTCENNVIKIICVLCNNKTFDNLNAAEQHGNMEHQNVEKLLAESKWKPVVGLDQITEYQDSKGRTVEYRCNICDLHFHIRTIFWHIVSYHHKEQYFHHKHNLPFASTCPEVKDLKSKHQKLNQLLLQYHCAKDGFQKMKKETFTPGMISSTSTRNKLNMSYVKGLYSSEQSKLGTIPGASEMVTKFKALTKFKIENDEQFNQGKEILQKINHALLEFINLDVSNTHVE